MAVYTALDRQELESFIEPYGVGPLLSYEGVAAGIENTTYFITTDQSDFPSELKTSDQGEFVLTVYEATDREELGFFIELTTYLNLKQLPVPCPITNANGEALQMVRGKPALLAAKIPGAHPATPSLNQCTAIAKCLATLHLACLDANFERDDGYDLSWLENSAKVLAEKLTDSDRGLLNEIDHFKKRTSENPDLPRSIIHNDLFTDNALFDGDDLTAIIDFNSASTGYLIYDLAVVVNSWCSNGNGQLELIKARACLKAYQQVRPFTEDEKRMWNDFLRIAATRFWLSRLELKYKLEDKAHQTDLVEHKDPDQYKNILIDRISTPVQVWP